MDGELEAIRAQIAQRRRRPPDGLQLQAEKDAQAAAAKREQAVAMAETARAALEAALAAKESLADQLRAERQATAVAQAVAARAREETRDARQKEQLARQEVEESWQVAECIAKTFDQSIDFSTVAPAAVRADAAVPAGRLGGGDALGSARRGGGPTSPPAAAVPADRRTMSPPSSYPGSDGAAYAGSQHVDANGTGRRRRQVSAGLSVPIAEGRRPAEALAQGPAMASSHDHFRSTLRSPPADRRRDAAGGVLEVQAQPWGRSPAGQARSPRQPERAGGRRAASGEAAQMNDDIDTLSRRMQEMQRLVEEQRGAMAKLALGRRGRGGEGDGLAPTISQEAARLQLIDEQLEELEDTLRTVHSSNERRRPLFWPPFSAVTEPAPGRLVPLSGILASRRRKPRKNEKKRGKNGRDMA